MLQKRRIMTRFLLEFVVCLALGCFGMLWAALGCFGCFGWAALGCFRLLWVALGRLGCFELRLCLER